MLNLPFLMLGKVQFLFRPLWSKGQYLQQILCGEKTLEVRVGYANFLCLKAGDLIRLNDHYAATIRKATRMTASSSSWKLKTSEPLARPH